MSRDRYTFKQTSSYLGCIWYTVTGPTGTFQIEARSSAPDYERRMYNGSFAEWKRDVFAAIGTVHRASMSDTALPRDLVDAFNAWRRSEHSDFVAMILEDPERYGHMRPDDPVLLDPMIMTGARYVVGHGWVVDDADAPATIAA